MEGQDVVGDFSKETFGDPVHADEVKWKAISLTHVEYPKGYYAHLFYPSNQLCSPQ